MTSAHIGPSNDVDQTQSVTALSARSRAFVAFQSPVYRSLWYVFTWASVGFWVCFIGLQGLMLDLTDGSGSWLGLLYFATFIPMMVITPFAGALADRVSRKAILMAGFAVITLLTGGLASLSALGLLTPARILPFALAIGVVFAVNAPANQAIVTASVPVDQLNSAISMQSLSHNVCRVIGPAVAAIVLAWFTVDLAIGLYALIAASVVVWLGRIHAPEVPSDGQVPSRYLASLVDGLRRARGMENVIPSLIVMTSSSLTAGAYLGLLPVVAEDLFDSGATGLSILSIVTGFGSVVGAVITGALRPAVAIPSTMLPVGIFGASFILFGVTPNWTLALIVVAFVGLFYYWGMTAINTLILQGVEDEMRGRIMSLYVVSWGGVVPVGALWQGVICEVIGVRPTIILCGSITTVAAALAAAYGVRRSGLRRFSLVR